MWQAWPFNFSLHWPAGFCLWWEKSHLRRYFILNERLADGENNILRQYLVLCCRPDSSAICLRGHSGSVQDIAHIPDGLLVSVSHDSTMRAWRKDDFSCAAIYRYDSILQKSSVRQFIISRNVYWECLLFVLNPLVSELIVWCTVHRTCRLSGCHYFACSGWWLESFLGFISTILHVDCLTFGAEGLITIPCKILYQISFKTIRNFWTLVWDVNGWMS